MANRIFDEPIVVALRARPLLERERGTTVSVEFSSGHITAIDPISQKFSDYPFPTHFWSVDNSKGPAATNEAVYTRFGKRAADAVIEGFNSSVLFVGAGTTGKSHTMFGTQADPGVVSRLVTDLATRVGPNDSISLSLYSIANNVITDMLLPLSEQFPPGGLALTYVPDHGLPYIENLRNVIASSTELSTNDQIVRNALANLSLRQLELGTMYNNNSYIAQINLRRNGDLVCSALLVEIAAIDSLHAAEKRDILTNSHADDDEYVRKLKPSRELTELAAMAECLARGEKPQFVPGKLTSLLKTALMGNSRTLILGTLSPSGRKFSLTQYTLRLLSRLQRAKNKALKYPYAHIHTTPTTVAVPAESMYSNRLADLKAELTNSIAVAEQQLQALGVDPAAPSLASVAADKREDVSRLYAQMEQDKHHLILLTQPTEQFAQQANKNYLHLQRALHRVPHPSAINPPAKLVSLARDALLSGAGAFPLMGEYWQVCRKGSYGSNTLLVNGMQMLNDHCTITLANGDYVLATGPNARVSVNGVVVSGSHTLQHGDRVVFGANTAFIFVKCTTKHALPVALVDFAGVACIDTKQNGTHLGLIITGTPDDVGYWKAGNTFAQAITGNALAPVGSGSGLAYDYAVYEMYRDSIRDMVSLGTETDAVKAALKETELAVITPLVSEANALCAEMSQMQLRTVVKVNQYRHQDENEKTEEKEDDPSTVHAATDATDTLKVDSLAVLDEAKRLQVALADRRKRMDSGVVAYISNLDNNVNVRCSFTEFGTILFEWRELYNTYVITGDPSLPSNEDLNPFFITPHGPQLAGTVRVYLQPLYYLLCVSERCPIIDYKGDTTGKLELQLYPLPPDDDEEDMPVDTGRATSRSGHGRAASRADTASMRAASALGGSREDAEVYFDEGDMTEFEGQPLRLVLYIRRASGIPKQCSKDVYVRYKWPLTGEVYESDPTLVTSTNPKIEHRHIIHLPSVSRDEIKALHDGVLEIQVFGLYPRSADALGADPLWQRLVGVVEQSETRLSKAMFEVEDTMKIRNGVELEDDVEAQRKKVLDEQSIMLLNMPPEELINKIQQAYDRQTALYRQKFSLENQIEDANDELHKLRDNIAKLNEKLEKRKDKKDKKDKKEHSGDSNYLAVKQDAELVTKAANMALVASQAQSEKDLLLAQLEATKRSLAQEGNEVEKLRRELRNSQEQLSTLRSEMMKGGEATSAADALVAVELRQKSESLSAAEAKLKEYAHDLEDMRAMLEKQKQKRKSDQDEYDRQMEEKEREHEEEVKRLREALKNARLALNESMQSLEEHQARTNSAPQHDNGVNAGARSASKVGGNAINGSGRSSSCAIM